MSGITGWLNYYTKREDKDIIIKNMSESISHRGKEAEWIYEDEFLSMAHRGLYLVDEDKVFEPVVFNAGGREYAIACDGELYNKNAIRDLLKESGLEISSGSTAELILKSYILWGESSVRYFNGVYAYVIWDKTTSKLFAVRDRLGIKPLFYTVKNGNFIFGSEIKSIFEFDKELAVIDKEGLSQILGLGPARPCGSGVFKNISELKPAHFLAISRDGIREHRYWEIEMIRHTDSAFDTIDRLKYMMSNIVNKQLTSDKAVGCFLSGGLDSSSLSALTHLRYEKEGKKLKTFSVDYVDNDKNFVANDFQPDSDKNYINMMNERYNLDHKFIVFDTNDLISGLFDAMKARDIPGMADVDSSLLALCSEVNKDVSVALSGEGGDEIFGGYPWFYREDALDSGTFPWSTNIEEREKLMHPELREKIDIRAYINKVFFDTLDKAPYGEFDDDINRKMKKVMYLNIEWFGATLLDRTDRMAAKAGLTVRMPFVDHELVEYAFNIPWDIKTYGNMEKGILRHAMSDYLPEEVWKRKKSPYPKTHNPTYLEAVKNMLGEVLENPNSPVLSIVDEKVLRDILETDGKTFTRPWFGQLMTGPQLMAYMVQVNMWLDHYKVKIEI